MDAHRLTMSGNRLTEEEAESLEKLIEKNPRDVASRTKLLGYYSLKQFENQSAREARRKHILWLIQNSPESEVLGIPDGWLHAIRDPEAYSQGKKAWIDHIKKKPKNLKILENSAHFFLMHDKELAIDSLQKARSLDMNNPKWPERLGFLHLLYMTTTKSLEAKTDAAEKALEQFEIAYKLSTEKRRDALLQSLAEMALAANKPKKASQYAEKMLSKNRPGWNYGNNIHHGNIILGRIALASGDIEEAKKRLIQAGKTGGSPQLNSFGPTFILARELLEKGEKDVVLEYLDLVAKFWANPDDLKSSDSNRAHVAQRNAEQLSEWRKQITEGRIPQAGKWRR